MSAPNHHACGHRATRGRCPICERQNKKARDRKRLSASARGYDHEWQEIRAEHLARHPNCVYPGCTAKATVCDHKVAHRGSPKLFYDRNNLQSLCRHHHNSWKQSVEKIEAARQAGSKDPWA